MKCSEYIYVYSELLGVNFHAVGYCSYVEKLFLFLLKALNSTCQLCTNHSQHFSVYDVHLLSLILSHHLVGSPPGTGDGNVKRRRVSPVL